MDDLDKTNVDETLNELFEEDETLIRKDIEEKENEEVKKSCGCNNPNCNCGDNCTCGDDCKCGESCDCSNDKNQELESENKESSNNESEVQSSNEMFNNLLRLQAEFDNYRKRTETEKSKCYQNGFVDAITDFLPALDSFKMAKDMITDKNTLIGIEYIEKGILSTLEKMGVSVIDTTGKFDPNFHQAIELDSSAEGYESGDIVKECYKGFKMGDKVIRYSQVIVKK